MRLKFLLALPILAGLLTGPALAASYKFTLHNLTNKDVTRVTISKGTVVGFKRIFAGNSLTFTVEFPDGECWTSSVRVRLQGEKNWDLGRYNVCSNEGFALAGR